MTTLYDIVSSMSQLLEDYAEAETQEQQDEILKLLKDSKEQLVVKAENAAKYRQNIDSDAAMLKIEIDRLTAKKKSLEAKSDRLKEYIGLCLGEGNKLKTPLFSFYWMPSISVDASLITKPNEQLPAKFVRVIPETYEVDKKTIAANWKVDPESLPDGVRIIEKQNLVIK